MVIDIVALVVCVIGAVTYVLADPKAPKASEMGRIAFAMALLVLLLHLGEPLATRVTWR